MTTKEAVIELVQSLPEDVSFDEIMYHLYVRQKVESGLEELDAGQGVPHAEVVRRIEESLV